MLYVDATDLTAAHEKADYKTIKENIRFYMKQRNIPSRVVAEAIGIKLHTAHAYKNVSNVGKPELKNLMKFAEYFGISVYDLLKPTQVFYKEFEAVL